MGPEGIIIVTVDSLCKHVPYTHTHNISTESLDPIARCSVQVSFVISMLVDVCMTLDVSTARTPGFKGVLIERVDSTCDDSQRHCCSDISHS